MSTDPHHTYVEVKWLTAPVVEEWEQRDDWRPAAAVAGVNVIAFGAAELFGLSDLLGICLAVSLFMLAGSCVVWELRHRCAAIALAIGTLPFWVLLIQLL